MDSSPTMRQQIVAWATTVLLPIAAWFSADGALPYLHQGTGLFFAAAATLSAAVGGMRSGLVAAALNAAALNLFFYVHDLSAWSPGRALWSVLLFSLALIVAYSREKWSSAELLAGRLSSDLARLRAELDGQRTDLKRFHDLSVRLSSNLELQKLLNDILSSIVGLQKTDLALLLLLDEPSGDELRVEAVNGFTAEQVLFFGPFRASVFSLEHRVTIEDVMAPGTNFPFADAAAQIGFRGVFSTPIVGAKERALGVVVTFFRKPHAPSERQSRLVELYVRQAANALDNARLYRDSLRTLAAEQQRSALLRSLAEASVQINSALSLDSLLQAITDQARTIIGARQAFTTLLAKGGWSRSLTCYSAAEGGSAFEFPPASSEMFVLACTLNKPVRLNTQARARRLGDRSWPWIGKQTQIAQVGWLAAPLLTRDGRNLGLIQLADKVRDEFSADDEALLVQLAHMASVAIDNVRLYGEAQEKISEIKHTQEALERSKESLQLAQQCVGIGIWEWELETGVLTWSDELARMHGFAPGGFDGRYESWMESVHPEDRHQVHQSITEALAECGEYEVQYRIVFADKSIHWLDARGRTVIMNDMPVRMLGVALDVTARKLSEEALNASEKLAATGHLAASIAHEINNPLAAVTNALYILRTAPGLSDTALDYVKVAEGELSRVVHITKQTLGFYREVAAPVATSIPRLLEEVLVAYEGKIQKNNITVQKLFRSPGQLAAFPSELRQVFSNLVLNALEAVAPGGTIFVRVKPARNHLDQRGLRITVADSGAGIQPDHMPRIFEPFFSTKESRGTGLGLWVSKGIVQKHGGSVRVRSSTSAQHHGTCFVVFLPLVQTAVVEAREQVPEDLVMAQAAAGETGQTAGEKDVSAA